VLKALERVRHGKRYFSEEINDMLIEGTKRGEKTVRKSPFLRLSRREKDVLRLIVDEHTTQEIADKLFISFGTVETHRRNVFSKLGARNSAGLVRITGCWKTKVVIG
jgi:DNA-binding NarL/FixJ family response regulator